MAIKHAFVSTAPSTPDPNDIDAGKWNEDHVIDHGGMTMQIAPSMPATPEAGNMVMYSRSIGGRAMPAFVGPAGVNSTLQPFFGRNRIGTLSSPGSNQTAFNNNGMPALNAAGTGRAMTSTNLFQSIARIGFQTAATANTNGNWRSINLGVMVGNQPKIGGFLLMFRFGASNPATATDGRVFVGLSNSTSSLGTVSPSTLTNIIGIGYDPADANFSVFHNDGIGGATKIPLGNNFPAQTLSADIYDFAMFCAPNSQIVSWAIWRLNTDDMAEGTINSDLPIANQLNFHINLSTGASASAIAVDVAKVYLETDN